MYWLLANEFAPTGFDRPILKIFFRLTGNGCLRHHGRPRPKEKK
jgi:hypothetical protein